jgi:PAS domain S-box-containing protein
MMNPGVQDVKSENEELKVRLAEAEEALAAIRNGEVDAIVVSGEAGEKVFSLTSAETPYRILIEEMEEGAVTLNEEGVILYCNKRFITMTGLAAGTITGNPLSSFIDVEDHPRFKALLKKGKKERSSTELKLKSLNQQQEFYLFTANALPPGISGDLFIIISNITVIKKYEQHLHQLVRELETERKRFRDLLDIIPAYIVLIEPADFSIYYSNNYFRERYGKSCLKTCHELIFGRSKVCENCGLLKIFSLNYPYYGEMTDPDGRIYQIVRFPFTNEEGKALIFEMGTDITDKKRQETISNDQDLKD